MGCHADPRFRACMAFPPAAREARQSSLTAPPARTVPGTPVVDPPAASSLTRIWAPGPTRAAKPSGIGTANRVSAGTTPSDVTAVSPSGREAARAERTAGRLAPREPGEAQEARVAIDESDELHVSDDRVDRRDELRRLGLRPSPSEIAEGKGAERRGRRHPTPERGAAPEPPQQRRRPAEEPSLDPPLQPRRAAAPGRIRHRAPKATPPSAPPRRRNPDRAQPARRIRAAPRIEQAQHVFRRERRLPVIRHFCGPPCACSLIAPCTP